MTNRILVSGYKKRWVTYLENISKLVCNGPITFAQLVLPEFHIVIHGKCVDCCDVLDSKVEHVKGRIPPG